MQRTGVELLGSIGLEWSTLGLGLVGLLIASPTARRSARGLAISALAGGMRLAQGISSFGGQIREGMATATGGTQPQSEAAEPAVFGEAPLVQ